MRNLLCRLSIGLLIFSTAAEASAQAGPSAQPSSEPPTVWQLAWQDSHCSISTGDPKSLGLALWMTPGDPDPQLYIIGSSKVVPVIGSPGPAPGNPKSVTVVLAPTGETFQADVDQMSTGNPTVLKLRRLRHKFPSAFSKASEVRLVTAPAPISIPIHGAAKAMAALQECIGQKLTEWGVDAKAFGALRKPPTDIEGYDWLTYQDYPISALDENAMGAVIVRLNVDATGKVSDCAVVLKSGSSALDKVTCDRALKKGKFDPAIGPDGQPTAASRVIRVDFKIWQ
jgi:TonB family protein